MGLEPLLEKVKSGNFTLGIIGIGRVGLPLGLTFAHQGITVIGIDVNEDYVRKINNKEKPFHEEHIDQYLGQENFRATTDSVAGVRESDLLILTIGTPIIENARRDYSQLYSALGDLIKVDIRGKQIIMRSTASPGTLESVIKPFLEKKTQLKAGEDFGLAVCPERILEGKAFKELQELPEIVGGITPLCCEITAELFRKINKDKTILFTTPKSAELAKLFTNVYRYVKFALANEFGLIAEEYGEDAHEIIALLNKGYKRGGMPIPGLTGGPCLSKDGYYLTSNILFPDFILTAWRLNESIPQYIVNKVKKYLEKKGKPVHDCTISILGAAFKAESDDTRYSPAMKIAELLETENADVRVHDPYISSSHPLEKSIQNADAIILATNHPEFADVHKKIQSIGGYKEPCLFMDCWGQVDPKEVQDMGFHYIRFGSGKGVV